MRRAPLLAVVIATGVVATGVRANVTQDTSTRRVSVATGNVQATGGDSGLSAISADGRLVVFESNAANLVDGDTNGVSDIFVRDRTTGETTRVSRATGGGQGDGGSTQAAISADGRFVAFNSTATNLVADDTNGNTDVFVHDRTTGETTRVSVSGAEAQATGGSSFRPTLSADGNLIAFDSSATNLVPSDTNGHSDVFVRNRSTGETIRASVPSFSAQATGGGSQFPTLSDDGRFVAFTATATNLAGKDTNGAQDIFVRDLVTATTSRVSVRGAATAADGPSFRPAISGDGRFIAFHSSATNLVSSDTNGALDVFVRDRSVGSTTRASLGTGAVQAAGGSHVAAISRDGRFVAFQATANNLVPNDTNTFQDIFVHDRSSGTTSRVSVSSAAAQATNASFEAAVSADGRFVAFSSRATDLVDGDTNGRIDIFVRDRGASAGFVGFWQRARRRCGGGACAVTGRVRVANPGFRTAARSRVDVFLSRNRKLDRRDRRLGKLSLAALKAGEAKTLKFGVVVPGAARGFVIARLDVGDRVDEPNEADNVVVSKRL